MSEVVLLEGDCIEVMQKLIARGVRVDVVVCDPPYLLEFMGKEFDSQHHAEEGVSEGAKMQAWHRRWVVLAFQLLKPGGYLLAFGGTRTYHRLACAVEDAGFEIRDSVAWLYGQGFPKSLDVSKAIDKAAGAKRKVVGSKVGLPGYSLKQMENPGGVAMEGNIDGSLRNPEAECAVTAPATDDAKRWEGYGTALKPAIEPIVVARKPLEGTVAQNVLKYGTGGLNIDGCRVRGPMDGVWGTSNVTVERERKFNGSPEMGEYRSAPHAQGRWPANVVLSHHPDCKPVGTKAVNGSYGSTVAHDGDEGESVTTLLRGVSRPGINQHADSKGNETVEAWECVEGCPVREFPSTKSGDFSGHRNKLKTKQVYGAFELRDEGAVKGDEGSAARFFYCAKASRSERNAGVDSAEIVYYDAVWVNAVLAPVLQAATGLSPEKVTDGSTILGSDGSAWSTCWCGSLCTDPYHPAIRSIIETKLNSTTRSTTSSSSTRLHTSGCMGVVFCGMESGGSLVRVVGNSSPWAKQIGISVEKDGRSMADAELATSVRSWLQSKPEGGGLRVSVANTHPT